MSVNRVGPCLLALGGALVAIATLAPLAHADPKFGYVNYSRIMGEYKGVDDARRAFEQEVKVWEKEEERLRAELDSLAAAYKSQNMMLTDATRTERESAIRDKKTAYEEYVRATFGGEGKVAQKEAELMRPILEKVKAIVDRIGAEEKFTMILDATSGVVLFSEPGADLTTRIVEELNRGTP